jgi:alpha-beta hydrolase superfamily lysophospholipase
MSEWLAEDAPAGAAPVVFQAPAGACLGWFHAARGPARSVGVVMCRPMGYEALCSYRTYTQLAQMLAEAGFDVLRFDYHGTGDSAGGDGDPGRVQAWLDSIACATQELQRMSHVRGIALFGLRLGATLAVEAAVRRGGVDSLVLWAPCASGRAFAREMRAANAGRALGTGVIPADGDLEGLGNLYTAETLAALSGLQCERLARAPARQVLIIGRDDMPAEGPLPARYRELGMATTYAVWPGYTGMVAEPHEAVLEPATLASITEWLCAAHPAVASNGAGRRRPAWPGAFAVDGAIERPLRFGDDAALVGVLSEPAGPAALSRRTETAVLMLNVGGNYRIGPNRVYVKLARQLAAAGYQAFRMDVGGIGDSRVDAGFSSASMYRIDATADVSAAIDMLAARGCKRFYLLGICSGSYLAFQTALADPRVSGQVLMNSRLLEWDATRSGPWQSSMQQYYKSTRYYQRALLRSEVYARLLRGHIDVRGIAGRLWTLAEARMKRALLRALGGATPQEDVLARFKQLSERGADTLVVMSEADDGLDYMEFHLGRRGARMKGRPGFRMVLIEDADHTFSTVASQRAVIDTVRSHLDARHHESQAPSPLQARVATT